MAGLSFHENRWIVSAFIDGVRRFRRFANKADAEAYMKDNGLTLRPNGGRKARSRSEVIDTIASNFEVDDDGCWVWSGELTTEGYAQMNWRPLSSEPNIPGAHRVVLHAIGQPVPRHLVVDHLCRNRACVNPDHLEAVPQRVNVLRSPIAPGSLNARKTHCSNGHPFSAENTYVYASKSRSTTMRICRTCQHDQYLARRSRRMGADVAVSA